jgi:hypothetical protein
MDVDAPLAALLDNMLLKCNARNRPKREDRRKDSCGSFAAVNMAKTDRCELPAPGRSAILDRAASHQALPGTGAT